MQVVLEKAPAGTHKPSQGGNLQLYATGSLFLEVYHTSTVTFKSLQQLDSAPSVANGSSEASSRSTSVAACLEDITWMRDVDLC